MFRFVEIYASNMLVLDICALDRKLVEKFFGIEVKKTKWTNKKINFFLIDRKRGNEWKNGQFCLGM